MYFAVVSYVGTNPHWRGVRTLEGFFVKDPALAWLTDMQRARGDEDWKFELYCGVSLPIELREMTVQNPETRKVFVQSEKEEIS